MPSKINECLQEQRRAVPLIFFSCLLLSYALFSHQRLTALRGDVRACTPYEDLCSRLNAAEASPCCHPFAHLLLLSKHIRDVLSLALVLITNLCQTLPLLPTIKLLPIPPTPAAPPLNLSRTAA